MKTVYRTTKYHDGVMLVVEKKTNILTHVRTVDVRTENVFTFIPSPTKSINELCESVKATTGSSLFGEDGRAFKAAVFIITCLQANTINSDVIADVSGMSIDTVRYYKNRCRATGILSGTNSCYAFHLNEWHHPELWWMNLLLDCMAVVGTINRKEAP